MLLWSAVGELVMGPTVIPCALFLLRASEIYWERQSPHAFYKGCNPLLLLASKSRLCPTEHTLTRRLLRVGLRVQGCGKTNMAQFLPTR